MLSKYSSAAGTFVLLSLHAVYNYPPIVTQMKQATFSLTWANQGYLKFVEVGLLSRERQPNITPRLSRHLIPTRKSVLRLSRAWSNSACVGTQP